MKSKKRWIGKSRGILVYYEAAVIDWSIFIYDFSFGGDHDHKSKDVATGVDVKVELRCRLLEPSRGQENITSYAPRLEITPDPGRPWSQEEDHHQMLWSGIWE